MSTMHVRRLTPDDWQSFRDIRLLALADAPHAFGSTLAQEQALTEPDWRRRLSQPGTMIALALQDTTPVGIMGAYTPADSGIPLLIAAWVAPDARGRGIADLLVAEVLAWVTEQGRDRITLRVADGNEPARKLFLRNGFHPTGEREPLESNPTVGTEVLARDLS
jgi:RimJ/RimL family protein N-acetyltransferase